MVLGSTHPSIGWEHLDCAYATLPAVIFWKHSKAWSPGTGSTMSSHHLWKLGSNSCQSRPLMIPTSSAKVPSSEANLWSPLRQYSDDIQSSAEGSCEVSLAWNCLRVEKWCTSELCYEIGFTIHRDTSRDLFSQDSTPVPFIRLCHNISEPYHVRSDPYYLFLHTTVTIFRSSIMFMPLGSIPI